MGCIVFIYDMVSYADSSQFPYRLLHGPGPGRDMNTAENWGYFSPQAESDCRRSWACRPTIRSVPWTGSEKPADVDPQSRSP